MAHTQSIHTPFVISTWSFGRIASAAAWSVLRNGGSSLDAVEQACIAIESDPSVDSVGFGGLPDANGHITLDGAIMVSPQDCGSVAGVSGYLHPVSIARHVMTDTSHTMLVGSGAEQFAAASGMSRLLEHELLSDKARKVWEQWKHNPESLTDERYKGWIPPPNIEECTGITPITSCESDSSTLENESHNRFHDTIGVIAIDQKGEIAVACSTSGMAFKLPGRVGDSPIIGHGVYAEPGIGAAIATGSGELIMGVCGSFLAVELLRNGLSALDAAKAVIKRIADSFDLDENHQAAILVMDRNGHYADAALRSGYRTAVMSHEYEQPNLISTPNVLYPK